MKIFSGFILGLILSACAAQTEPAREPGVEDISPGQQTVISAPQQGQSSGPAIPEKNI